MALKIKGSWNDKASLVIPCPECGHKTNELISKLQKDKSLVCGGCGKTINITGNALDELAALKKTLEKLR